MDVPDTVAPEEILGRAVFESKKAKQAAAKNVPPKLFREKRGVRELSVDRLSFDGLPELAALHADERAPRKFHGWATVRCADALDMDREVVPAETAANRWHAEIILPSLPEGEEAQDVAQKEHSVHLARRAGWRPWPGAPSGTTS
jgi:hypothetical protein